MRVVRSLAGLIALVCASPAYAQVAYPPSVQTVNGIQPVSGNVTIPTTQFVTGYTPGSGGTVASLLTNQPCSVGLLGQYADVTDLYNNGTAGAGIDDILRCRYDAANSLYRWTPQREAFNGVNPATTGTVTITPLVTPPTVRMTGTLAGNVTLNAATTNAYVGQRIRVVMNGTLGIFTATITGLIGSNLTVLGGSTNTIEYGPTGWFQAGN